MADQRQTDLLTALRAFGLGDLVPHVEGGELVRDLLHEISEPITFSDFLEAAREQFKDYGTPGQVGRSKSVLQEKAIALKGLLTLLETYIESGGSFEDFEQWAPSIWQADDVISIDCFASSLMHLLFHGVADDIHDDFWLHLHKANGKKKALKEAFELVLDSIADMNLDWLSINSARYYANYKATDMLCLTKVSKWVYATTAERLRDVSGGFAHAQLEQLLLLVCLFRTYCAAVICGSCPSDESGAVARVRDLAHQLLAVVEELRPTASEKADRSGKRQPYWMLHPNWVNLLMHYMQMLLLGPLVLLWEGWCVCWGGRHG